MADNLRNKSVESFKTNTQNTASDLCILKPDTINPTYEGFKLSYDVVCRERRKASKQMYDKQFKSEIKNLEAMQASAYDQMRFHRFFAITTLWPPLHSRKEVDCTIRKFYQPSQKHSRRLNFILENTIE